MILSKYSLTTTFLLLVASLSNHDAAAQQQQENNDDYQCGISDLAKPLSTSDYFDTIHISHNHQGWRDNDDKLTPKKMHWHIYAIPDGQTPRYSSFPDGLVEPKITNNKLEFQQMDILEDLGYSKNDRIRVAIELFVPISQLNFLRVDGVDQSIEVIVIDETFIPGQGQPPSELNIEVSAVNTNLYINAPYSWVDLSSSKSGVDNEIDMDVASDSSVRLSGVNQDLRIKSDLLTRLKLDGVDQDVLLEGDYQSATLSGVNIDLRVNGPRGCQDVDDSGVSTGCKTTSDLVMIPKLACFADTKVVWPMGLSRKAWIGVGFVCLVLLVFCVAGCCFAPIYCLCGSKGSSPPPPPAAGAAGTVVDFNNRKASKPIAEAEPTASIEEADVLAVEDIEQPPNARYAVPIPRTVENVKVY